MFTSYVPYTLLLIYMLNNMVDRYARAHEESKSMHTLNASRHKFLCSGNIFNHQHRRLPFLHILLGVRVTLDANRNLFPQLNALCAYTHIRMWNAATTGTGLLFTVSRIDRRVCSRNARVDGCLGSATTVHMRLVDCFLRVFPYAYSMEFI